MLSASRKQIIFCFYLLLLLLPCLELALLLMGYRPFHQVAFQIEATPEHCIIPHQRLGFALRPGQYEVTLNEGLKYTVQHNQDSLRSTRFTPVKDTISPAIWLFGCSYTYGMGVDDSLTFPFLIQKEYASSVVKNFGVPGYGTVQSYLQLQQALKKQGAPRVVIVNYAHFHDDRNALTPAYRRDLFLGYQRSGKTVKNLMQEARVPYVAYTDRTYQINYCRWDSIYQNWQYRETFATVNFLQDLRDHRITKRLDEEAATRHVFQQIKSRCDEHHIRLIVTGITPSEETRNLLASLQSMDIITLDISVDFTLDKYRNTPYDDHPSGLAHALFAQRIIRYLNSVHWY